MYELSLVFRKCYFSLLRYIWKEFIKRVLLCYFLLHTSSYISESLFFLYNWIFLFLHDITSKISSVKDNLFVLLLLFHNNIINKTTIYILIYHLGNTRLGTAWYMHLVIMITEYNIIVEYDINKQEKTLILQIQELYVVLCENLSDLTPNIQ